MRSVVSYFEGPKLHFTLNQYKTPLKKPRLGAPVWVEAGASGARSGAIVKKRKQKDDCQAVA